MSVFLTLCLVALASASQVISFESTPKDQQTAEGAVACGMQYADIDKDGRLSRGEVKVIRDLALGFFLASGVRLAEKIPGVRNYVSIEQIFDDCDFDGDGYITMADFERSRSTCLETPGKVEDAYKWVCDKGANGAFRHAKL